jgi:hypothetical protein
MILASLKPYLPEIEYREWERCGHYPWLERAVRDEFFAVLRGWLAQQATRDQRYTASSCQRGPPMAVPS